MEVRERAADYRTQAEDTSNGAERILIEAWKAMPAWRKFEMVREMNAAAESIAAAGIRKRHPGVQARELRLRLAALKLDRETMMRVFDWDPDREGY